MTPGQSFEDYLADRRQMEVEIARMPVVPKEDTPGENWSEINDYTDDEIARRFARAQLALRTHLDVRAEKRAANGKLKQTFLARHKGRNGPLSLAEQDHVHAERATPRPVRVKQIAVKGREMYGVDAHALLDSLPDHARPGLPY